MKFWFSFFHIFKNPDKQGHKQSKPHLRPVPSEAEPTGTNLATQHESTFTQSPNVGFIIAGAHVSS